MPTATIQTQAIQNANSLIAVAQQLMQVYQQLLTLDAAWTDSAMATTLAAMATVAQNADGSLGVADGTPNANHPISNINLSRSLSSTQIAQIKTIMDGIVNYVGGSAVSTQVGARAILNTAVGG